MKGHAVFGECVVRVVHWILSNIGANSKLKETARRALFETLVDKLFHARDSHHTHRS